MAAGIPYTRLYRVLRPDENPAIGITAKAPYSHDYSVAAHVGCGAYSTKYISTCATESSAREFASLGIMHRDQAQPKKMITIDVAKLKSANPAVSLIDLTNIHVLNFYIPDNVKVRMWAIRHNEVLIEGEIPSSSIIKVEQFGTYNIYF